MIFADEEKRLDAMVRVLGASVLCCLGFSWRLWLSRPFYPQAPVWQSIRPFPTPWDAVVLGLFGALLSGLILRPRSKVALWLLLAVWATLFLQDQNRWWPSFYQFFILLTLMTSFRRDHAPEEALRILHAMRFVLAAVYFWSGVQKLNWHFFHEEFPWFVEPLTRLLPWELPFLPILGVLAAVIETLIGVGLLTKRFRKLALYEAMLMHALIFFCIGPLRDNWNNSSWIWGLTVAVQAWILFYRAPQFDCRAMFSGSPLRDLPQWLAVLLIGVAPILNNLNLWDSALSFNVYSGNVSYAEIHLQPEAVDALPLPLRRFTVDAGDHVVLNINRWALSEFNANAYPEARIFERVYEAVAARAPPGTVTLYIREKATWFSPQRIRRHDRPIE